MGKIILIRHGEVTWNKQACYTGWTDLPLTEKGVEQARRIADHLASEPVSAVFSSDLERSLRTAEIIASPHGINPVSDKDLRELNYGVWEGIAEVDLPLKYPDLYAEWKTNPSQVPTPNGESFGQLFTRMSGAIARIMAEYPDGTVAVISHKSANRVMLCHWLGVDINLYKRIGQDNAAINIISYTRERAQVDSVNDTCHLR